MLYYIKLFIEREKNTGQSAPECPFKHGITRKLFKIDRYMLRGVWQALNFLSIHATYCVIVAGASPGKTKMWLRYVKTAIFCTCVSNNSETVEDRWVHAATGLAST